jgi:hypothetical protein
MVSVSGKGFGWASECGDGKTMVAHLDGFAAKKISAP